MARIAQLLPHTATVDGIQRAALDLTRGLAELGEDSLVLCARRGDNLGEWMRSAEVRVPLPFLSWRPVQPHRMARCLAMRVPAPLDVVIAHRLDLVNAAAIIGLRRGAPVLLHAHNAPPSWLRWGDMLRVPGTRRISRVIVASEYMHSVWKRVLPPEIDVRVVEYPIDTEHFFEFSADDRANARRRLGIGLGASVVGYVGRLEEDKGLHVLAQAARRLAREVDLEVLIQGAPNLGLSESVADEYRGRCDALFGATARRWLPAGPDVRDVLAASDVMVVPSVWQEPSGLTVSEALATGTPVVASRVGGIPAQLPGSDNARTVQADDAEALKDGVLAVLRRRPSNVERSALRHHVVAQRALPTVAKRYRETLRSVVR